MRCLAVVLGLFIAAALTPRLAGAQPALDAPLAVGVEVHALDVDRPCDLSRTIEGIARVTGIRVGVEQPRGCPPALRAKLPTDGPAMRGRTARALLDEFVERRTDYMWREANGVVYVLPATTMGDDRHPLRQPVAAFSVTNLHPHKAMHVLLESAGLLRQHVDGHLSAVPDDRPGAAVDRPISFRFEGGTLLAALSALAARVGGQWELSRPASSWQVTILGPRWEDGLFFVPMLDRPSGGLRE